MSLRVETVCYSSFYSQSLEHSDHFKKVCGLTWSSPRTCRPETVSSSTVSSCSLLLLAGWRSMLLDTCNGFGFQPCGWLLTSGDVLCSGVLTGLPSQSGGKWESQSIHTGSEQEYRCEKESGLRPGFSLVTPSLPSPWSRLLCGIYYRK